MDEEYGRLYKVLYGLDTYGMRYFNVFGRRQDPNGMYAAVIPKFIKQLMNGEVPTINGDGKQSRDFTYVDNVIEANLKACLASSDAAGEAFNIGAGGREYLIDVYHDLCKALGKDVEPNFGPNRAGDIRDSNADITKAVNFSAMIRNTTSRRALTLPLTGIRKICRNTPVSIMSISAFLIPSTQTRLRLEITVAVPSVKNKFFTRKFVPWPKFAGY